MSAEPQIQFRPIQDTDLPFLAELYASTRAEEMAQVDWPAETVRAFLYDQFNLQHHHYQTHYRGTAFEVVLVDGVAAGRRYVARWDKEIRLVDIALMPAFLGCGIGRRLMAELVAESDRTGRPICLHVEQNNRVLGWYHRLGFQVVDSHGIYFRMERHARILEPQP